MSRVCALGVPKDQHLNDDCPPHVMTEGPAGRFSFMMDGGAILCDETECQIDQTEASDLATGRQTVAAVTRRHAGQSGTAFVQGPEREWAARTARVEANAPRPIGLFRKLLGYSLALAFLLAGLGTLGAGMEEAAGDDLYAAPFMGGLLVLVGALIWFAVHKAATRGVRPSARGASLQMAGGGASGRNDHRDDDRRDDDRRDGQGGNDGGDDDGGGSDSD